MFDLASFAGGVALYAASFAIQFLFVLLFRQPIRPRWLRFQGSDAWAATIGAGIIAVTLGLTVGSLAVEGWNLIYTLVASVVLAVGVPVSMWKLMDMRQRLDACQRGLSPFGFRTDPLMAPKETDAIGPG